MGGRGSWRGQAGEAAGRRTRSRRVQSRRIHEHLHVRARQTTCERNVKRMENDAVVEGRKQRLTGKRTIRSTVYDMCTQKPPHDYSAALYEKYRGVFETYLKQRVVPTLQEKHGESMLRELCRRWSNHQTMVRLLSRFFNYLDRYYVTRHGYRSLKDVGALCFRDLVYAAVARDARDAILAMVKKEREGEPIDRSLVKQALQIFVDIGVGDLDAYQSDFEVYLVTDTSMFYKTKASEWVVNDGLPEYLVKAEECLHREHERVGHYLHPSSEPRLLETVEAELLSRNETELLEKEQSGCAALLQDDKVQDLARLFRLFQRVPNGLLAITAIFRKHVEKEGVELLKEADQAASERTEGKKDVCGVVEQNLIKGIIALHDKYATYVKDCFSINGRYNLSDTLPPPTATPPGPHGPTSLFHKALKEAFETVCNKSVCGNTMAEMLAAYCDNILKKGGSEKLNDEEVEALLEKVVKLLAYVADKDLFAEFYRKRLARRLLFDKCMHEDHERSLLSKLKQQCGGQFTSKMEGMVTDLQLAREHDAGFADYLASKEKPLDIDMSATVLTSGFWPSYKFVELALPAEMAQGVETFKEFYAGFTKHRKLTWIYTLGVCHVNVCFDGKRTYELVLTGALQAALLMLFNDEDKLSYEEVRERLGLPEDELKRSLHSLSCAKYKILLKDGDRKKISSEDTFSVNTSFSDKFRRIKVPLPAMDGEKRKVVEEVDKDRRYAIDAAIVRTMKSRKMVPHQQLVLEVVQQLNQMFRPDFKVIKKRIEDLIAREYLERDKENPNVFHYLA
mmetsp:Transcript_7717/g.47813  ORF Transcript_7717/g.47813 Transcript_7717/m.47813 type:complete len:793 (+) Transcript_7717:183-2561(+)